MNMDLATILVILVVVSGLMWLFDAVYLAPKRNRILAAMPENVPAKERQDMERVPMWADLARSLFPVFLIVLLLRSFLVEPFRIPSASMMPTLLIGDFILVNKYSYGIRLPVLNSKIIEIGEPQRGDVVVFRYPQDPAIPFIKRVVGLPGDHVRYHDPSKMLYVNGKPVPQEVVGVYQGVGAGSNMTGAEERLEELSEHEHAILVVKNQISPARHTEMIVPEGH